MINIQELRIDNYVCFDTKSHRIGLWDFATYIQTNIEMYVPIALTEEWLIKFDFEITYNGSNNYNLKLLENKIFGDGLYYHKPTNGWFLLDHECNDINDEPIFYVHQLQNLYFALTGKELILNN